MNTKSTVNEKGGKTLSDFCQGQEYTKRYRIFLERSKQTPRMFKVLSSRLPLAMENLSIQADVCKVLSVGAGDGQMTDIKAVKILKDISKKKIYHRVIEPNSHSLNIYKDSIVNLPSELSNDQVIFDIGKPQTFQEYAVAEKKIDSVKFDVVYFIHSIYFIDFEEALVHCYENELGESGMIFLVLADGDVIFETKKSIFNISQTRESIQDIIKKHGWKYQEYNDEYYFDVTEVFDDQSVPGNLLLDFLTQTINFRQTTEDDKIKEVMDVIRKCTTMKEGKFLCRKNDYYAFILK